MHRLVDGGFDSGGRHKLPIAVLAGEPELDWLLFTPIDKTGDLIDVILGVGM